MLLNSLRTFSTTNISYPDPVTVWKPFYDHTPEELRLMLENEFYELLTRHTASQHTEDYSVEAAIEIYNYLPTLISKMDYLKYLSEATELFQDHPKQSKTLLHLFQEDTTALFDSHTFDEKIKITKKSIVKRFNKYTLNEETMAN